MRILGIFILIITLVTGCSINPTAGGTTDTGNAIAKGTVVDTLGNPVSNTQVSLIPESYNPVENPSTDILIDTTNPAGAYVFEVSDSGKYNIIGVHIIERTRFLKTDIFVSGDTTVVNPQILYESGALKINLADTFDTDIGYFYVPGTDIYEMLSEEQILIENEIEYIIFDSLPSGSLLDVYYDKKGSSVSPLLLRDSVVVTTSDTLELNPEKYIVVLGAVVDKNADPVSGADAYLIPENYNPIEDPGNLLKTSITDASGNYVFSRVDSGTYNFQANDMQSGTRVLVTDVSVDKDTVAIQTSTLYTPGAVLFTLPDTVDTVYGYVYVPGTVLSELLSEKQLIYDNGLLHMVFDSLPTGTLSGIYYGETNSPDAPVCLVGEVVITEGDTLDLSIKRSWSAYTTGNSGIPQNNVVAVMVDASGMIWLGTHDSGLVTFDGSSWTVYNTGNSLLPHNTVQALAQDINGSIWIGTVDGLVNIVDDTWHVYTTDVVIMIEDYILDIAIDTVFGHKWLSTYTGVCRWDGNDWNFHTVVNSVMLHDVHAVAVSSQGLVMYGANVGIFTCDLNDENWKYVPVLGNATMNIIVWDIAFDNQDVSWLATPSGIISYNDKGQWGVYNSVTAGLPSDNLKSVAVYTDNTVWAGAHADGTIVKLGLSIGIYNGTNTSVLQGAKTINNIAVGNENTLYFATEGGGLVLLKFLMTR